MIAETNAEFLLTKILATLGPASQSPGTIVHLIDAGVRGFRMNFSHGTLDEHAILLGRVREASRQSGVPVAVLGDLSGPKIRIDRVVDGGVLLVPGSRVAFRRDTKAAHTDTNEPVGTTTFTTNYPPLVDEVEPGQAVLLDDGKVRLICVDRVGDGDARRLVCEVVNGGTITSNKGVNLPQSKLSTPALTEKDLKCVRFAVEHEIDALALSFVRTGRDVRQLKDLLREVGARPPKHDLGNRRVDCGPPQAETAGIFIPVISKIEKPQAIEHIDEIVEESDGVMVARGDLGVEMDLADVPVIQKQIIKRCQEHGKPVIVATQMLESMIRSPVPTRAEVSDIANAILDGADVVMLSGETAVGDWPVKTVEIMNRVATRTNEYLKQQPVTTAAPRKLVESQYCLGALASGASAVVRYVDAKLIVMWVEHERAPVYVSRYHMPRPILVFSDEPATLRRMSLGYGLKPMHMPRPSSHIDFIHRVDRLLLERSWAAPGDAIVFILAEPMGNVPSATGVHIHYAGNTAHDDRA